jgi:hypothetical protein
MKKKTARKQTFAVCLDNQGYEASLEIGKVYRVVADAKAAAHGYLRVIDESGEDYAFAAERFHVVQLPRRVGKVLESTAQA